MDSNINRHLLDQVIDIACEAGQAILSIYSRPEDYQVLTKSDSSPVTAADVAAHKVIKEGLSQLTPDTPLLSEEASIPNFSNRSAWQRYWLVDPLDGTKEFIHGTGEFTVNIALIDREKPVLGVVYAPVTGVTYAAVYGEGAIKISEGQVQAIQVRQNIQDRKPITITVSRRHGGNNFRRLSEQIERCLGGTQLRTIGSSLKICLIAEGEADIYPRFGLTCEWDTAAAQVVLEEAGGHLVNRQWQSLTYNQKPSLLNPEFLALGDTPEAWQNLLGLTLPASKA